MTRVFISYSRRDLTFVERLAKDLQAAGLETWYDLSGLEVGTRWGKEIQTAIQQSQFFLVVLSPNSIESEWVEKEFLYANSLKQKIIPLLIAPCNLPMWFINLHFMDFQGRNYKVRFPELLKALGMQPAGKGEKIASTADEKAIQAPSGSQTLPPQAAVTEMDEPLKEKTQLPADNGSVAKEKASQQEKHPPKQSVMAHRKTKIRLVWLLIPVGLVTAIALAVWGMVQMKASQLPPPIPTSPTMVTSTQTAASKLSPTNGFTPTFSRTPTSSPPPGIGSTWTSPKDGMVMVYVPEGDFSMGSDGGRLDESPVHTVYLDAFWIDRTEVTNYMYALCYSDGVCQQPLDIVSYHFGDPGYDNYPVTYVDWNMAWGYCRWAGKRLPTEAEWEKAARGTDGRTYPWGDSFPTCLLGSFVSLGYDTTACVRDISPVGGFPDGASPYGALDMAGNVWEWVNDWYDASYYGHSPGSNPQGPDSGEYRVLRGVSWANNADNLRSAYRFKGDLPDVGFYLGIGLRCAYP